MRSSSSRAFRSASAKSIGAEAFFAPSLAGRDDMDVVVLEPKRATPSLERVDAFAGVDLTAVDCRVTDEVDDELWGAATPIRGMAGDEGFEPTADLEAGVALGLSQEEKKSSSSLTCTSTSGVESVSMPST